MGIDVQREGTVRIARLRSLYSLRQQFRLIGLDALRATEILMSAPLVGEASLFGTRAGQEVPTADDERDLRGFSPAPGFRFDVCVRLQEPGVALQLILDEGEAYQVVATGPNADLTGSSVSATAPVAVFGANSCAYIPPDSAPFCDHTVEQMVPTAALGAEFIAVPSAGRDPAAPDRVRILGTEDSTTITADPPPGGTCANLNRGDFCELTILSPTLFIANHPIQVARFAASQIDTEDTGDPFQIGVQSVDTFAHRYRFVVDDFGGGTDGPAWVNVVTTSADCVILDGGQVPPSLFTQVGSSVYLSASIALESGQRILESDPVAGISVYGFAGFEGYGTTAAGYTTPVDCGIFHDGFESGDTSAWSRTVP